MDGLNRKFMNNPADFLRAKAVVPAFELRDNGVPAQGIHEFDFRTHDRTSKAVYLDLMTHRGKATTNKTNRIVAHWLPWEEDGTTTMQLDGHAHYFFTSQIAGCRIVVVPNTVRVNGVAYPRVMHIAGNRGGPRWRTTEMNTQLALVSPARLPLVRTLSSTGQGAAGYRGEMVNVVGFVRNNVWEFHAQQFDYNDDASRATVTRHWQVA